MKYVVPAIAVMVLSTILASNKVQAATFTEIDDAGETLSTAQVIQTGLQVESISGSLSRDADLYKIFLNGGQTFSATTINSDTSNIPVDDLLGSPNGILADPQLFLFDSFGKGVYANDDTSFSSQSILPSGEFSPSQSGIYYLAISSFNYDPVSAGGEIFVGHPIRMEFGDQLLPVVVHH